MNENEQSQIIRYVNTFTAGDWEKRPHERIKKGITRVTKSNSQSADKFAIIAKQKKGQQEQQNDQNHNFLNINKEIQNDPTSPQYLLERIKHLQLELTVLEKEKIQLERKVNEQRQERRPMENFVESHYIACKQDLEEIMSEKRRMEEALQNIQTQNNFLKLNIGIQEQYIIKVQGQLDQLRSQPNHHKTYSYQQFIQTDQPFQDQPQILQHFDAAVQIEIYDDINEYEDLNNLARKFEEQTNQFSILIEKLQHDNAILAQENARLSNQLNDICILCKESEEINSRQASQWGQKIKAFEQEYTARMKHQSNIQQEANRAMIQHYEDAISIKNREIEQLKKEIMSKDITISPTVNKQDARLRQEYQQLQKNYHQTKEQLKRTKQQIKQIRQLLIRNESELAAYRERARREQALEEMLKHQQAMNGHLQNQIASLNCQMSQLGKYQQEKDESLKAQFVNYKKQIDGLLLYLEEKNQTLRQRELQLGQQLESEQLIYLKNEETLRKQTEVEAVIAHYEGQIKRIQASLENYISQFLLHKREEKQEEIQQLKAKQQLQQSNNLQERLYLLSKIESLQQELSEAKSENKLAARTYHSQSVKLEEKQSMISKLRAEIMELSKKYELELSLKSKLTQENYLLNQKLYQEDLLKNEIRSELQSIKKHYDDKISSMQRSIDQLQDQLALMQRAGTSAKLAFEDRLLQVKKDYDVLYSKYMKYKSLSMHLQATKKY